MASSGSINQCFVPRVRLENHLLKPVADNLVVAGQQEDAGAWIRLALAILSNSSQNERPATVGRELNDHWLRLRDHRPTIAVSHRPRNGPSLLASPLRVLWLWKIYDFRSGVWFGSPEDVTDCAQATASTRTGFTS